MIIDYYWLLLMIIDDYWWLLMIIDTHLREKIEKKKRLCFSKRCLFSESDMTGILFREGPYILDVRHHRDS
jgi:hypothetical protein